MSLITCCPNCGTMFRVVPDQLKISEGWVRCGHCSEVFDATAHMAPDVDARQAEADTMPAPPSLADASPEPAPAPLPAPERIPAPVRPSAVEAPPPALDSVLSESPLDEPFVFRRSDLAGGDVPSVLPPAPEHPVHTRPSQLEEDDEDLAHLHQVSFVRQARRRAFWRRPMVRFVLVLGLLASAAALALQVGWQERDKLAVSHPQLRPALEAMCLAMQCTIQAPRQIESLAIESSSFNRLRGDAYRLNFTLKNNAAVLVAPPSLQLTLTDGQDQTVLQRVLAPSELAAPANIAAGAEWSASVGLAINANGQGGRIAGYRLLAFYP